MNVIKLLDKPKIIGVCADVNAGKSMLLYNIIEDLKDYKYTLYTYGLRLEVPNATQVYSVAELESIKNSIIVIDELSSLFDLDNRKVKKQIENTLRLINHNNNILILCGVPENFKKFISGKIDIMIYKKTTIADLINGCRVKNMLMNYKGMERGTEILNLDIDRALVFDGTHYTKFKVKYYEKYDSKKDNTKILKRSVECAKDVPKKEEE